MHVGFIHIVTSVNPNDKYAYFAIPGDFLNNLPICSKQGTVPTLKVGSVSALSSTVSKS